MADDQKESKTYSDQDVTGSPGLYVGKEKKSQGYWKVIGGLVLLGPIGNFLPTDDATEEPKNRESQKETISPSSVEEFSAWVRNADPYGDLVPGLQPGDLPTQVHIVVTGKWLSAPYIERMQSARLLMRGWQGIMQSNLGSIGMEAARIRIYDLSGRYVGGGRGDVQLK